MRSHTLLMALSLLAACGGGEERGELTAEEERQLNSAEQMLNDSLVDTSPDSLTLNQAELNALAAEANTGAPVR